MCEGNCGTEGGSAGERGGGRLVTTLSRTGLIITADKTAYGGTTGKVALWETPRTPLATALPQAAT
ncbi:hypothetical protein GCM10010387_36640 [Streptomyces inusitatus]|uniref:Uncharacterized protein n=1 Tax=Streptomyces inusitatus TaxID=68221 RepID=A0A918UWM7_9ACTN|nr:hypothetical protein GCM10010387_36640 [Streptomyces inusitatus]